MFAVRIHGRGGQGVVTAAELLALAAFLEERHAQAFPSFGSERTGAPVVSFCRIDDRPIRVREPIVGARRADHPGPDAPASGRRLRRHAGRRVRPDQHRPPGGRARPRGPRLRRARRPRQRARRASTSAVRSRTPRCSAGSPPSAASSRSSRSRPRSARGSRAGWRRATPRPRPPRTPSSEGARHAA